MTHKETRVSAVKKMTYVSIPCTGFGGVPAKETDLKGRCAEFVSRIDNDLKALNNVVTPGQHLNVTYLAPFSKYSMPPEFRKIFKELLRLKERDMTKRSLGIYYAKIQEILRFTDDKSLSVVLVFLEKGGVYPVSWTTLD